MLTSPYNETISILIKKHPLRKESLPVMLLASLIFRQSGLIIMVAHKSNLEPFAAIDRVGDTGTPDDKPSRFNAGELLQLL